MAQENSDLIRIKSRLLPMFKGQIFGSSLSVISASIIYLFFYKTNGYYQHLWYIVTLVIAVLRVGYCILYTQRFYNHDSVENQKVFENHYALLILFSAAIWGLSLFVFYPHAQNEDLVIPAIIPIGVLISALANLGTSKKVSYAFIGGLLSTYIAYFIFSWSSLSIVMTITGVLFIFSLKKSSDRSFSDYEALQDMLEQSRENLRLKEELEVQKIVTIQASKLASLGEMAGGIAHEINN
ncbi:MAG: hypothetical protein KDD61_11540, partial [Bdellovibrionales bacterium]|nr:hypothetical protein [Bdellovibrionales bacterium]